MNNKTVPPEILPVGEPQIVNLDTVPPDVVTVPTRSGTSYTWHNQDGTQTTVALEPPVTESASLALPVKSYHTSDGLPVNFVWPLLVDKTGNLWLGSDGGGVILFDGQKFTKFSTENGQPSSFVNSVFQDSRGTHWLGTWYQGIATYDGNKFTAITPWPVDNQVMCITEDRKGNMWFGTERGGAVKYDGKAFRNYQRGDSLAGNHINDILADSKGNIWFCCGEGLSKMTGDSIVNYRKKDGLAGNFVGNIIENPDGTYWISTGEGLSKFDGTKFSNYTTKNGLPDNRIHSLVKDAEGNLWMGSEGKGLIRFDGSSFSSFSLAEGLPDTTVWKLQIDRDGALWFNAGKKGSLHKLELSALSFIKYNGENLNGIHINQDKKGAFWMSSYVWKGLYRYDKGTLTNYSLKQGLPSNVGKNVYVDKEGFIWYASDMGLSMFDGKNFTTYSSEHGLPNNNVWDVTEDRRGKLWVGTEAGAVMFEGNKIISYGKMMGYPSVWSIKEDRNGAIWFGTESNGIIRFDGKTYTRFTKEQGLQSNQIWNILEDRSGNLLFATLGGVSIIRKNMLDNLGDTSFYNENIPVFENFTTTEGLADNAVWDIAEDSSGNLFISTNLGLTVLKGGLGEKDHVFSRQDIEYFNEQTGYPIKDGVFQGLFIDKNNVLWGSFASNTIRFDYNRIKRNARPVLVSINGVKINNRPVSWHTLLQASEGTIRNGVDSFTVNFTGKQGNKDTSLQLPGYITPAFVNEEVKAFGSLLNDSARRQMVNEFGNIRFDSVRPFNPLPENLVLPHRHNDISFDFAAITPSDGFRMKYQYKLEGYDEDWSLVTGNTFAQFNNLSEGKYTFLVKAVNPQGIRSEAAEYTFEVLPPWWRSWWAYLLYGLIAISIVVVITRWRTESLRRDKSKLEAKVRQRTEELNQSLETVKKTQQELIQREKMASLGELTAGIAHEIQNPLNFVNNFSDLNKELISELQEELKKGDVREASSIAEDLKDNEEKINLHGRRADSIVKSMLQHSRSSSGQKEPTDVNKLADEYTRLAYHGFRARNKDFNVKLDIDLDPNLPLLPLVPQDIGRVILNLLNNAFQAVQEKARTAGKDYQPTVSIQTKSGIPHSLDSLNTQSVIRHPQSISIAINDNGPGIPDNIKHKIFQPFFTTKSTGQGTGLGLSLAYDIVTKGHGGELKMETKEWQETKFTISIPIK